MVQIGGGLLFEVSILCNTGITIDSRRVKYTGLEMQSHEPYIRIMFLREHSVSRSCVNFCSLVVNLQVSLKSVALIEPTREYTPGKVIASVNAISQCMSDINEYPCCYSPVRLYATTIRAL